MKLKSSDASDALAIFKIGFYIPHGGEEPGLHLLRRKRYAMEELNTKICKY